MTRKVKMEPNFSGWVTRNDIECTDGRTIRHGAFEHQNEQTVPLLYQHNHDDVNQVLGKVVLKHMDEGVWGDAYLDDTPQGVNAGKMVKNKTLDKFSIWAKNLVERGADVLRGDIQEVSLVLSGANKGAVVKNVLAHSSFDEFDDIAVVGGEIMHSEEDSETDDTPDESEKTVGDVLSTLTEEQSAAVNAVIDDLVTEGVTEALAQGDVQNDADGEPDGEIKHSDTNSPEGNNMRFNLHEKNGSVEKAELKHSDVESLFTAARDNAVPSLRDMIRKGRGKELLHAEDYGVQNIEILFPDAVSVQKSPTWVDRRQEWVRDFIAGTHKTPFSRIKTFHADITADEARAKGYIKGNEKTEEVFPIFQRTTGPAWIYKKQKLDREDIISVKSFDIVAWLKAEMRGKVDEELARAGLFGDGRPVMLGSVQNPDKIKEPSANSTSGDGIRSIYNDHTLYTSKFPVGLSANPTFQELQGIIDEVTIQREHYRGSGNLTGFITFRLAAKMLTMRDAFGHRIYKNLSDLAGDLEVNKLVRVPTELFPEDALLVLVDLSDYNFGTDGGGELTLFDDFDIDFNQYKYLMEVYLSGALTLPYSAQVFYTVEPDSVETVTPAAPDFTENTVTIPNVEGVVYTRSDTMAELDPDEEIVLTTGQSVQIIARPAEGYAFADGNPFKTWNFAFSA